MDKTVDYGCDPGMIPAPMIERIYKTAEIVEQTITFDTPEWKAYYRLSCIYASDYEMVATYYLDDVEVKEK